VKNLSAKWSNGFPFALFPPDLQQDVAFIFLSAFSDGSGD